MPLSEARKTANKNWDTRNIEKMNAIKRYYRHRDEYLRRQRERYHVKRAQRLAAERQERIREECRIELNAMYGFEFPRLATQTPTISVWECYGRVP